MAVHTLHANGFRCLVRSARCFRAPSVRAMSSASGKGVAPPDVKELAKMAYIEVTDQEVADWEPKITGIVDWFSQLQAVDVGSVKPAVHARDEGNVLRPDTAVLSPVRSAVMDIVPVKEEGYVRVPKIATGADTPATSSTDDAVSSPTSSSSSSGELSPEELTSLQALELRVGKILSCEAHPDADSLYVEQVDVGESEPRTIVSGLVKYVPLEAMQGRAVVVLCNLKARNMRGIKSHGMLLAASDEAHEVVEPLVPPPGAAVGSRLWWGQQQEQNQPLAPNSIQKKKVWEGVQPVLRTDDQKRANFKGALMQCAEGAVTSESLTLGRIG